MKTQTKNIKIFNGKYGALLDKYLYFEFHNEEEQNEYLNQVVAVVNDNALDFEDKVAMLSCLIGGVNAGWRIPDPNPSNKINKIETPKIEVHSLISTMSSSLSYKEIDSRMRNIEQYISPTFLEFCLPKSESHC